MRATRIDGLERFLPGSDRLRAAAQERRHQFPCLLEVPNRLRLGPVGVARFDRREQELVLLRQLRLGDVKDGRADRHPADSLRDSILLWSFAGGTIGQRALGMQVRREADGRRISLGRAALRYAGYLVAWIPLALGIFWIGLDPRKQGWHDKIAGTFVIRRV